MLSYRIQGLRNPTLEAVPAGAKLKILFVNMDDDMKHDVRFGQTEGSFPMSPEIKDTAGTNRLTAAEDGAICGRGDRSYRQRVWYLWGIFCSVLGHESGGMWGNIVVGAKPDDKTKPPEKTTHKHDEMAGMPGMKMDDKKPGETTKKPDEMSDMPGMNHQHKTMETGR